MITLAAAPRASRLLSWLAAGAALWLAVLIVQYFFTPLAPRYRLESVFMIVVAAGIAAAWLRSRDGGTGVEGGVGFGVAGTIALVGLFGAGAILLYGSAMGVGLLSDDFVLVDWARRREWVHRGETGFVRPAVPMLWAALSYLPGAFDVTVHGASLALHAVNAVLVSVLATRIRLSRAEALLAGALFLSFPAFTEAVVWASGVQDVLMATLVLTAVLAASSHRPSHDTWGRLALAGIATAIALAVKETAVVVPGLVGLVWWGGARRPRWRTMGALVAVVAAYSVYRVAAGIPASYFPEPSRYFLKQLIVEPFASLGAPWAASWTDRHPLVAAGRALVILGLILLGVMTGTRRTVRVRLGLAASGWVLISVLPVLTLFHVAPDLQGSRYLYLPAVGFTVLLAALAGHAAALAPRRLAPGVLALAALVLIAPSLPAVAAETARWAEAARARDAILARVDSEVPPDGCASFVAEGLADNVEGAYVFRNGLAQASAIHGHPLADAPPPTTTTPCEVSWDGHNLSIAPVR